MVEWTKTTEDAHAIEWPEDDRINTISQNGNDGLHYAAESDTPPPSKYHVKINGDWADVYDVLHAFGVTNPATAHAVKKLLKPGQRGHKSELQDLDEAAQSIRRAMDLVEKS